MRLKKINNNNSYKIGNKWRMMMRYKYKIDYIDF